MDEYITVWRTHPHMDEMKYFCNSCGKNYTYSDDGDFTHNCTYQWQEDSRKIELAKEEQKIIDSLERAWDINR